MGVRPDGRKTGRADPRGLRMNAKPRPFKPASPAVLEGVEKFRALRRAFLRERYAALTGGGDCVDRMDALDRCEIAYREAKLELFQGMRYPTRQAVWDRL